MRITEKDRLIRALSYLEAERKREEDGMKKLEGVQITQVIIARNQKAMYMAQIDQDIRNTKAEIELAEGKAGVVA